jgi:ketosteroid isomerase-like protein
VSAALEFVDEDTVFEPLRSGTEGAFVGREGMRRFLADTAETFALFKASYTDVRDLGGGRLLAIGSIRIRGSESGVESDVETAAIVKFRDGVLVHYKDYGDARLALEAAGLSR